MDCGCKARARVNTRRHHFLDSFGKVSVIEDILKDGPATVFRTQCQLYLLKCKG